MIYLRRTDSRDQYFGMLVKLLDEDLAIRDGAEHAFFAQYNTLDAINNVVVAYFGDIPSGCGAIKKYNDTTMEVKRMFVHPDHRRKGIARAVLTALEKWTEELGYPNCILETGKRQPEAIALYKSCGYKLIPNYGQYANVESSVCLLKELQNISLH